MDKLPSPHNKTNSATDEIKAFNELRKDESIIIKEADKGGAVIIMDKNYYAEKIHEMLNDPAYYEKCEDMKIGRASCRERV